MSGANRSVSGYRQSQLFFFVFAVMTHHGAAAGACSNLFSISVSTVVYTVNERPAAFQLQVVLRSSTSENKPGNTFDTRLVSRRGGYQRMSSSPLTLTRVCVQSVCVECVRECACDVPTDFTGTTRAGVRPQGCRACTSAG